MAKRNPQHSNILVVNQNTESDLLNTKKILQQIVTHWWLYLILVLLTTTTAFFYLRYRTPLYQIHAKILVKDSKKGSVMPGTEVFQEIDFMTGLNSVDNEVELLKSRTLMEKTVASMQLNATYFVEGAVKKTEVYQSRLPFRLTAQNFDYTTKEKSIWFEPVDSVSFQLEFRNKKSHHFYGDTINLPLGNLIFARSADYYKNSNARILVEFMTFDNAVKQFQDRLHVAPTNKTVSTIDITLSDPVPERGQGIVNTLLSIYDKMNTEDKNRIADSTISFIDDRLAVVSIELSTVEGSIQNFRESNNLTDISSQGKLLLDNANEYVKQLTEQEVQINIVNALSKYLNSEDFKLIPTTLTVQEPTLLALVGSYNTAQIERDRQIQTTGENNPIVKNLNSEIPILKKGILSNLNNVKNSLLIRVKELNSKIANVQKQIGQVPSEERSFLEYSRQQSIKQELYLYLLKKREETAVSKSANINAVRIIDSAKSDAAPYSPKQTLIYAIAVLGGIVIPSILLVFKNLFNNKITSKKDIADVLDIPIVGEIGNSPAKNGIVVSEHPRHPIAEQFRHLRTNLNYLSTSTNSKARKILFTSSMSNEGKSFLATNLAALLATAGRKTVLIEFDLRKPKISTYFNIKNEIGISSFVVKRLNPSEIIKEVSNIPNLSIISSGPIPPNPVDIITNERISELFEYLSVYFDEIIIDAPPIGIVTDAQLLEKYADVTLYILRQNYTFKQQLEEIHELQTQKRFKNIGIVLNDIRKTKGYGNNNYRYEYYSKPDKSVLQK